jgi:hypothetical protein
MTLIGYTMMCEQAGPKQLVRDHPGPVGGRHCDFLGKALRRGVCEGLGPA